MALALVATMATSACGGSTKPVVRRRPSSEAQHRPPWLGWITTARHEIALCLEGRESPSYVMLVYREASDVTIVSTVDAFRMIEHCGVEGGKVVLRQPGRQPLSAYEGMPLFSLGPPRPHVPSSLPMEEVVDDRGVLGWIHWPQVLSPSLADLGNQPTTEELP